MKETIKKSFVGGLVFLLTVIGGGLAFAAVHNSVNSGDPLTASIWNNAHNYSTDEVNTGKKWIDGKDIYRKVINIHNFSPTSSTVPITYYPHGITNISDVIGSQMIVKRAGLFRTNSYGYYSNLNSSILMEFTDTSVGYQVTENYDKVSVVMEYTKN